jgi:glycosyltransferase involved in cell wall biosynthesis
MKFSILIPTVPSRWSYFNRLCSQLLPQIASDGGGEVELLGFYDNKMRKLGPKRNDMLMLAQGEYLAFIDDDDRIPSDYVATILTTLKEHPEADVVVFEQMCSIRGGTPYKCVYGVEYDYIGIQSDGVWYGKPAHTMVWRSAIAKKHAFPDKNFSEDTDWVKLAVADVKNQVRLAKVLYYYDADDRRSETVGR